MRWTPPLVLLLAACGVPENTPPTDTTPTWYRDVEPLIAENCAGCHYAGGIGPFPLTTYEEVSERRQQVADSMQTRRMPPWMPDESACEPLKNSRHLPQADIDAVLAWSRAGAPKGDVKDQQQLASRGTLPWTDLTIDLGVDYTPRANVDDDYHCFIMDPQLTGAKDVIGFDIAPGSKRQVHHVILYAVPAQAAHDRDARTPEPGWTCYGGPGVDVPNMIGGWVPGSPAVRFPGQTGIRMYPGDVIVAQVHYNLQNGPLEPDRTQINLQYAANPVPYVARMLPLPESSFRIPPMSTGYSSSETIELPVDAQIWGVIPHMHQLGKKISVDLLPKVGETAADRCLVTIPQWDFHWQQFYFFQSRTGLKLNAGEQLKLTCTWDNPTSQQVRWGEGTSDEMCLAFLYVTGAL